MWRLNKFEATGIKFNVGSVASTTDQLENATEVWYLI